MDSPFHISMCPPGAVPGPVVVAVSGVKNSGKTTLIEGLLPLLAQAGLRTAVIKHDGHRFQPDLPGTDSFRHREAGALAVGIFDEEKSMVIRNGPVTEQHLIAQFQDADLILMEGFKHSFWPKLELVRSGNSDASVCDPAALLALVTDLPISLPNVPTLSLDPEVVAAFLLRYHACLTGKLPSAPLVSSPAASVPGGPLRSAIIDLNDERYAAKCPGRDFQITKELLVRSGYEIVSSSVLPHDRAMIASALAKLCDSSAADLILTLGGTGISPYHCTPEATLDIAERPVPGISEAMRRFLSFAFPSHLLDRSAAGIRRSTLVVNLPGDYTESCLSFLLPVLLPALEILRGEKNYASAR